MGATFTLPTAKTLLVDLMVDLGTRMGERLDEGSYNASGRLKRSIGASFVQDAYAYTGTIYASQYWKHVANGRPPGKMPPPSEMAAWALAKGLTSDPDEATSIGWAIAKKIAKEGSRGFRNNWPNQFDAAVDDYAERIDGVLQRIMADDVEGTLTSRFRFTFDRSTNAKRP